MNKGRNRNVIRVLLVEDSAADAELARYEIRKCSEAMAVHQVTTLPEVSAALEHDWSAIVCDFRLPGFTAYDVLQRVRALSSRLPFVVVSHEINDADSVRLFEAGADDVLSKAHLPRLPYMLKRRIATVSEYIPQRGQTPQFVRLAE